jgi:hypothetical protein
MKQLLFLISLLSIVSIHPYAFVFGSKSDAPTAGVNIAVFWPDGKVAARHQHIMPGNHGRNAEWNWESIRDQSKGKIPRGGKLQFVISKGLYGEIDPRGIIYKGEIASDGRFGFITKKEGDRYVVRPDQQASDEYRPA